MGVPCSSVLFRVQHGPVSTLNILLSLDELDRSLSTLISYKFFSASCLLETSCFSEGLREEHEVQWLPGAGAVQTLYGYKFGLFQEAPYKSKTNKKTNMLFCFE